MQIQYCKTVQHMGAGKGGSSLVQGFNSKRVPAAPEAFRTAFFFSKFQMEYAHNTGQHLEKKK